MVVEDGEGRLRLYGLMPRALAIISIKLSPDVSRFQSVKGIYYRYSQKLIIGDFNCMSFSTVEQFNNQDISDLAPDC
jgi:hypothetical protein